MHQSDCCTGTICGAAGLMCCIDVGGSCTDYMQCCTLNCTPAGVCATQFVTSSSTSGGSSGSTSGGSTTAGSTGGATTTGSTSGGSTTGSSLVQAIAFNWTFNGTQTCEQAGIGWIQISNFAGLPTQYVPCRGSDGVAGATFTYLPVGSTSYTLAAFAAGTGRVIYDITGNTTVTAGLTTVGVVFLLQVNPSGSNLNFQWTFNGGTGPCTSGALDGGVLVSVQSDAGFSQSFPCSTASAAAGTYQAGPYAFAITASWGDGGVAYQATGSATVNGVTDTTVLADLAPPGGSGFPGNLIANMTFGGQTCVAAGVDTLYFTLRDATGNVAGNGNNDSSSPCVDSSGTLGGTHYFSQLATGTYWLEVTGLVTTGATPVAKNYYTGQVAVTTDFTAQVSADASPPP
jgi:hypothetical protein